MHAAKPSAEDVSPYNIGLTPSLMAMAFPFHIVFDSELHIVQFGDGIGKLDTSLKSANLFEDHLTLQRPVITPNYASICAAAKSLFLLTLKNSAGIRLRGQMLVNSQQQHLIFVGSPYFTSTDQIKTAGLTMKDFALHDNAPDLLLLLKTNHTALEDAQKLTTTLNKEKEHAQVVLSSIGEGVIAATIEGSISYMNTVAEQLTGHKQSEARGRHLQEIFQLVDSGTRQPKLHWTDLLPSTSAPVELPQSGILLQRNDDEIAIEGVIAPIKGRDDTTQGLVVAFRDVTDQRNMSMLMEYQATHEQLTKLPNRMLLHERAEQAIREARRRKEQVALLFLDLDRFKTINDSLGHQVGDALLKVVAKRLLASVRDADVVSRLGGDEFVILLTQLNNPHIAGNVAQKVLAALAEPITIESYELNISVSIGISIYPDDSRDVDGLLRCADLAMYSAKEAGRDTFHFFESELDTVALERMAIENALRVALERNQFELYYQPKLVTGSREIIGCEALLRWNHPEKGQIAPDRFIPIAEETGLILELGEWVIRTACEQAKTWNDDFDKQLTMAVNVSWLQLYQNNLGDILDSALAQTGLAPHLLELEFTESVLMHNADSASATLQALRARGIQLSIDDFGTGYSSLNYLKRFPLDTLKIDRSFITDICKNKESHSIVEAIVNLSQILGLQVVAEGVETSEQHEQLSQMGCEQVQGFLFSKPVMASELAELIGTSNVCSISGSK